MMYTLARHGARFLPQPAVGAATGLLALLALTAAWSEAASAGLHLSLYALGLALGLAGAIVVAYQYPIHVRHQTKIYLFTLAYYLLAVLVPAPLAAAAAGLGSVCGELSRRGYSGAYPSDIAAEAGRRVLMVLCAAVLAQAGGDPAQHPLAVIGAGLALAALDVLTLPLVLAPMSGERPLRALIVSARETLPADGVQYALGLLGALAALHYPCALFLMVIPAALVYAASKILMEMHDGTRQLLENMADAVDLRDPYTGGHSGRVTAYCAEILRELGLHGPEADLILAAARVHDIGKIGLPDAILHKPGPLTDEERAAMELHPVHGAALLKRYRDFARGVEIVRHHHERWDGAGYPDRLAGTAIPFGARVVAVADSFDAMTSDRPYRSGMSAERAAAILRGGRGEQWDTAIVDALLRAIADRLAAPSPSSSLAGTRPDDASGTIALGTTSDTPLEPVRATSVAAAPPRIVPAA